MRVSTTLDLAPWIEHLARHVPVAQKGADPEGAHQLRVAAARLDVALRAAGQRVLRDDLRRLRRAASAARDLDVLLERSLPKDLSAWLSGERRSAYAQLSAELKSPDTAALLLALELLPPLRASSVRNWLGAQSQRVVRLARRACRSAASVEDLHELRRALRRVRYGREWLGRPTGDLKRLQDLLGELNDEFVALEHIARCPLGDELQELRTKITAAVARRTESAQQACRRARLRGTRTAR